MATKTSNVINAYVPEEVDAKARELQTQGLSPGEMKVVCYWLDKVGDSTGMRLAGDIDYTLFNEEVVAAKWNRAGSFKACLQSRASGPDGIFKGNLKVWRFGIDDSMVAAPAPAATVPAAPPPATNPGTLDLNGLVLSMMKNQSDVQLALLKQPAQPAPSNALPLITALAPIFGPALAKAFFEKTPASDVLALFDAISKRAKGMGGGGSGGEEADTGDGGELNVKGMVYEALKLVRLGLERTTPAKKADAATPAASVSKDTTAASASQTPQQPAGDPAVIDVTKITRQLTFANEAVAGLIERAKAKKPDASAAADFVIERAKANEVDIAEHMSGKPEKFVASLIERFPHAAAHRDFLVEVASELKARAMNARFAARVVAGLIDVLSDEEPSTDAGASLVECVADRCGMDMDSFAEIDAQKYAADLVAMFPQAQSARTFIENVFAEVKERAQPDDEE